MQLKMLTILLQLKTRFVCIARFRVCMKNGKRRRECNREKITLKSRVTLPTEEHHVSSLCCMKRRVRKETQIDLILAKNLEKRTAEERDLL